MVKFFIAAVLVLIGLYLTVTVSLFIFQRRLIYPTDPTYHTPAEAGLDGVQEVKLTAPDGVRLIAWELKPAQGQPTLLYFHGNGGGLFGRAERFRRFARVPLGQNPPPHTRHSRESARSRG